MDDMKTAGAKFIIDWHNSAFTNELICLATANNTLTGVLDFKKVFLESTQKLGGVLKRVYDVSEDMLYYTCTDSTGGMAIAYMNSISQLGCYLEETTDPNGLGQYSPAAALVGASLVGMFLVKCLDIFGIIQS
jgi:hypothetical protein